MHLLPLSFWNDTYDRAVIQEYELETEVVSHWICAASGRDEEESEDSL